MSENFIREADSKDAENLINLMNQAAGETDYLSYPQGAIKTPVEKQKKYINSMNEKSNCLLLVAERNEKLVGMLDFSAPSKERTKHRGEFGMLVAEKYWGQGIGKRLLKRLLDWAVTNKIIKKINLKVREDNIRAIKLYEKMGFTREGSISREFCVRNKLYSAILMGREIN